MITRRSFIQRTLLGVAAIAVSPQVAAKPFPPSLWITDSESTVALCVELMAHHCGILDTRIFTSKRTLIHCLLTAFRQPRILVTDFLDAEMRGNEFIRLARHASPDTSLILHSAVIGSVEQWIAVSGQNAPRPDAIIEKPDARSLMAVLSQMR